MERVSRCDDFFNVGQDHAHTYPTGGNLRNFIEEMIGPIEKSSNCLDKQAKCLI